MREQQRLSTAGRQRGMTLPMTALFIIVLLAMASLAVDLGVALTARTSAQHAADAAALAGAYNAFIIAGALATPAEQVNLAGNAAIAAAQQNKIMGKAVTIPGAAVQAAPCPADLTTSWVCVDTANQRVKVNVAGVAATSIATYFARAIGWNSLNVATIAEAEAWDVGTGSHCIKPIFLPNTIVSTNPIINPDGTPGLACTGKQYIFDPNKTCPALDGSSSTFYPYSSWFWNSMSAPNATAPCTPGSPTGWPNSTPGAGSAAAEILNGYQVSVPPPALPSPVESQPMDIRPTSPSGALEPSQFYSLDFGSGAATYRCTLANCLTDCDVTSNVVNCGDRLPLETGNMVGPTNQGINDLNPGTYTFQGANSEGQYIFNPGGEASSPAEGLVAVWDACDQTLTSGYHGQNVQVIGFAQMFFAGMNRGNVSAYLLDASTCEAAAARRPAAGPLGRIVRLIQPAN